MVAFLSIDTAIVFYLPMNEFSCRGKLFCRPMRLTIFKHVSTSL
jgi:hypothetical protein